MDCYEVKESDGGGVYDNHFAFVATEQLAKLLVATNKNYRHYCKYSKLITVFDTMEEIEANSKANLRKAGLAKLSKAEKDALGLS